MQENFSISLPESCCLSKEGLSLSNIPTRNFLIQESEDNRKFEIAALSKQLSKLFKAFMFYVQEEINQYKRYIDKSLRQISFKSLAGRSQTQSSLIARLKQQNQILRWKLVQQERERSAQISQHLAQFEKINEKSQIETALLKRENYTLSQEIFNLKLRFQSLEVGYKDDLEFELRKIKQEHEVQLLKAKRKERQLSNLIKTKDQLILQLRSTTAQKTYRPSSSLSKELDQYQIVQIKPPSIASPKIAEPLNPLYRRPVSPDRETRFSSNSNKRISKIRSSQLTQDEGSQRGRLRERRHTPAISESSKQRREYHRRFDGKSPARSPKVDFRAIEQQLQGLSYKLKVQINNMK